MKKRRICGASLGALGPRLRGDDNA